MSGFRKRIDVPTIIAAVLAINGFLNLATGLTGIFKVPSEFGFDKMPEYLRVAPSKQISGFLSVFLGLLLIALGKGLYERRRRSWALSLIVLVVLMVNNLYRGTTPQTAVVSGALIAGLLFFHRKFSNLSEVRLGYTQIIAFGSVVFALGYGIIGSYMLRTEFSGIKTLGDSIYFTFVTYSTLGYGDILPETSNAKIFVTTMIPIGLASFITALTALLGPAIEKRMKGVMSIMKRFQHISNHVIVCGYTNVSESAVDELQARGTPYVIIDDREDLAMHLRSKGHDVILGDPTRKEVLEQAELRHARALIAAFDSDSVNVLVAITAGKLRSSAEKHHFRIVVRVEDEENIDKAREVGADEVISPSTLAGRMMAARAIEKTST